MTEDRLREDRLREALSEHVAALAACRRCPTMAGTPVAPPPVPGRVYLVGQAPGPREAALGRPFAWTAGRQLFRWFASIGVDEATFRARVFMAATCRCFPGKARAGAGKGGGDRVPSRIEQATCGAWMDRELALLRPALIVPVGRLAIERFLGRAPLVDVIGRTVPRGDADVVALPHPSGLSTWWKTEPGASLTEAALGQLAAHPAWRATFN